MGERHEGDEVMKRGREKEMPASFSWSHWRHWKQPSEASETIHKIHECLNITQFNIKYMQILQHNMRVLARCPLTFFLFIYLTKTTQPGWHRGLQSSKRNNTTQAQSYFDTWSEPRTLTYLPTTPKPNLEKHAKTEFWRCCYVRIPHKNNILTVKGRPPPQFTVLSVIVVPLDDGRNVL